MEHKSYSGFQESPSSEPQDDSGTQAPLLLDPQGFGKGAPLSCGGPARLQKGDAVPAVSLLPRAEDFGVLAVPEEGPAEIRTHQPMETKELSGSSSKARGTHQPAEIKEPSGSSSKARSEFHIASTYTHLTLVYAAYTWGEPAPSPRNHKQKGPPGTIGEEGMHESVCPFKRHMLV